MEAMAPAPKREEEQPKHHRRSRFSSAKTRIVRLGRIHRVHCHRRVADIPFGRSSADAEGWRWFFAAREYNSEKSVAIVQTDLNAIQRMTDGSIWVVGDGGMLLHSSDGWNWQQVPVRVGNVSEGTNAAARSRNPESLSVSLLPRAEASEKPPTPEQCGDLAQLLAEFLFGRH
jgi:hypothetical protein